MSVESKLQNGITVGDLMEELKRFDPEAVVVFGCDYGDHGHTEQALPVESVDSLHEGSERIEKTAYSRSGLAIELIPAEDDYVGETVAGVPIVVLR